MADLFTISSDVLPTKTHVVSLRGTEGLSRCYQFAVGLLIQDDAFDPDEALRGRATLTLNLGNDAEPYVFHGIFARVVHLHEFAGKALFEALLVPELWNLTQTFHSRVFTDNTIVEIIEAILTKDHNIPSDAFSFQLMGKYPTVEHICQYKESSLAFISRWMEREGMYYFFEQGDEREKLIITDDISLHSKLDSGAVRYVPLSGSDSMALEALDVFQAKHSALPAQVQLKEYNYRQPTLKLDAAHPVASDGHGDISIFGEHYLDTTEGDRLAKVRAQEYLARQKEFQGRGRVFHLRPNYRFTLEEHPRAAYNNKTYLVTEIEHYGNQSGSMLQAQELLGLDSKDEYSVQFTAIPADVQYRSPDQYGWPRIDGYEIGVVCGMADSEYAQIDDQGRYKIRVKFDESDLVDGSASTYVRMLQPHGGTNEGFHFPLRKATEVLLFFLGGDPDRPVIAGVVPNPVTPSPITINNYTKNIIQTGGLNLIEINDLKGEQYVYVYCPTETTYLYMGVLKNDYHVELHTHGHCHFYFGGKHVIEIKNIKNETVKLDVTVKYQKNYHLTITEKSTLILNNDVDVDINANFKLDVSKETDIDLHLKTDLHLHNDLKMTVNGAVDIDLKGPEVDIEADNNFWVWANSNFYTDVDGKWDIEVDEDQIIKVHGAILETVDKDVTQNITGNFKQSAANLDKFWKGASSGGTLGWANEIFIGGKLEVKVGAFIELMRAIKLGLHIGPKIDIYKGLALNLTSSVTLSIGAAIDLQLKAAPVIKGTAGEITGTPFKIVA